MVFGELMSNMKPSSNLILSYKFEIFESQYPNLIHYLNEINQIVHTESGNIVNNSEIDLDSFDDKEYDNAYKGKFCKKLADLTHKNYLNFNYSNKSRLFRIISEAFRKNFKSLKYKQTIAVILEKYKWDIESTSNQENIRSELKILNLYPTTLELKNLCRAKTIPQKTNFTFLNQNNEEKSGLNIPLDYTCCDSQIITQQASLVPTYNIKFQDKWYLFQAKIPKFIQNKLDNEKIEKFCKPKFQLINQKWYCVISYILKKKQKNVSNKSEQQIRSMGVDLGLVKNYSASVVKFEQNIKNEHYRILQSKNITSELLPSRESNSLLRKVNKLNGILKSIYQKIDFYKCLKDGLLNNQKVIFYKNKFFKIIDTLTDLENKIERLLLEKMFLRKKIKNIKKHKSYCIARDIVKQIKYFKVNVLALERLNWVENKGGGWDFSQQQEIIQQKVMEASCSGFIPYSIDIVKVNPAYSSNANPYLDWLITEEDNNVPKSKPDILKGNKNGRSIVFKHKNKKMIMNRDHLAGINLSLRGIKKKFESMKILNGKDDNENLLTYALIV